MKQTHENRHDDHRVHQILYHLIWCPRHCRPVLVGRIGERCRELIAATCTEEYWELLALALQPDHLHLFVRVTPSTSAADVVKAYKGVTSFSLRRKFPPLLRLPSMWTRSYFARYRDRVVLWRQVSGLEEQLATRRVVERAAGILMERYGLTEPAAFRRMAKLAMNNRKSMREVAEAILLAEDLSEGATQ